MNLALYPPQEPLSALGQAYQDRIMALGEGIEGCEAAYGDDPYQSLAVFRPASTTGEVLVYRSFPLHPGAAAGIAPLRRASGVVGGDAAVATDRHGCDVVAVRPSSLDLGRRGPRR